jgi:hypothetical protein
MIWSEFTAADGVRYRVPFRDAKEEGEFWRRSRQGDIRAIRSKFHETLALLDAKEREVEQLKRLLAEVRAIT